MGEQLASTHYGEEYFAWQESIGRFGAAATAPTFKPYIHESDTVLDFGCGGGFLLRALPVARRVGVEPGPEAATMASRNGVEVYTRADQVPDDSIDVVISNHALEHTLHPLAELKTLHAKLRVGGRIVVVVPCEAISNAYTPDNIDHHLYTWSPMCLGNLFSEAGFHVVESKPYMHKWPPYYRSIRKVLGRVGFDIACRVYARLDRRSFQVRTVGEKR